MKTEKVVEWGGGFYGAVKTFGFPVAMCIWLLISFSPKLDRLIVLQEKTVTILENRSRVAENVAEDFSHPTAKPNNRRP